MKKLLFAVILFAGCSDNSPNNSGSNDSFEYNYAKNRVKMEGYSDKDSDAAAKAIVKFHEAQKRRK